MGTSNKAIKNLFEIGLFEVPTVLSSLPNWRFRQENEETIKTYLLQNDLSQIIRQKNFFDEYIGRLDQKSNIVPLGGESRRRYLI